MLSTALRILPWLAVGLALACEPESKPPAEPTADATKAADVKADVTKAEPSKAVAKAAPAPKAEPVPRVEPAPRVEPTPKAEPAPKAESAKPAPARTALFFRKAPKERLKVWHLPEATASDPTAARDLGIVADDSGGSVYEGTSTPVLSADGQWLAYLDQGRLELARVDGTAKHRITKHKWNRVLVLITGFSPDSSRLLFHQGEVQTEEGAALPKGVVPGFHELTLADLKLEPKTSLESFIDYTADGRHVILERTLQPDRIAVLSRFDLDTGAMEELQRGEGSFAFSQLVLRGERIAYVRHPKGKSQVVADALRGGELVELSPEGSFAQYQWPQISLDGRHVVYSDEKTVMIRALEGEAAARVLTTCAVSCDFAWDSGTTLLLRDGEQLSRVTTEGVVTALATEVEGFAVAGDPG